MKSSVASIVSTVVLVLLVVVGVRVPRPPEVVPADAPQDRFSAERARRHLEAIAREPHAMGTAEHARVRDYLVGELRALGVEPELHEAVVARGSVFGRPINVLGRLEGESDGKAVVLVSHYDTVPTSPGAGDDSAGVAAMLETLRALAAGPPLANDVVFLFTDGEEAGLLGARTFVDRHPWAEDAGMVLNFEARGSGGPSFMFETSPGNAPLVAAFDRAVAWPAAESYSYEVYRRMPNDTDYSVFRRAGMAGLNFAFIGGGTAYHTAQDSLERLDLASVQQHGEAALSLARHFGDADLAGDWSTRDAVYFNLPGNVFVRYPSAWAVPLAVALVIAALALIVAGVRRRKLTLGGLAVALPAALLIAAAAGGLAYAASGAVMQFYNFVLWRGWTSVSLAVLALALAAAGVTVAGTGLARRKLRAENLFGAGLVVWTVLAVAVSLTAPGASYLFALPLAGAVAAGAVWIGRKEGRDATTIPAFVVLVVSAAVTVFLWAPTLALLGLALGQVAAVVVGLMVPLLLIGPLMPNLAAIFPAKGRSPWISAAVLIVAALALGLAVRSGSRFSESNRRPDSLIYYLDSETGEAAWLTFDRAADEWTSKLLSDRPEPRPRPTVFGGSGTYLANDAPVVDLEGATVEWLGEEPGAGGRRIRMRLVWPFEVHRAVVHLSSDSPIGAISSAGQSVEPQANSGPGDAAHRRRMTYFAPPPEGLPLEVEVEGDGALEVEAIGQRYGLPEIVEPRPAHLMPTFGWATDSTYVRSLHTWTPADAEPPDAAEETAAAGTS